MTLPLRQSDNSSIFLSASSELSLKLATPADGETMNYIAELVLIDNLTHFDRGFLLHAFTAEEYSERLQAGYRSYLFYHSGRPIGFVLAVRPTLVGEYSDPIYGGPIDQVRALYPEGSSADFIFICQFAILPREQNKGYGELLGAEFCSQQPGPYYGQMLEAPLRNPRVRYWCMRGMKKVLEYQEPPSREYLAFESDFAAGDLLTWGIYRLDDGKWSPRRTGA